MLFILAIILALAWVAGFTVMHVSSAAIHVLIVVAVAMAIVHFVRRRRVT